MPSPLSRRAVGRLLTIGAVTTLAACSSLNSMLAPSTVEISREELLKKLSQQFPLRNQILDVFDVTANAPRLTMQPDANRVLADIDLSATDRWFKRQYQGSLWLSFGLRYEPRDQTIRLANVTIDKVSMQGLPDSYQRQMTKLGGWLTEDRLQDYVVHRFTPEELRRADEHGLTVADIKITQRGLAIKLAPKS